MKRTLVSYGDSSNSENENEHESETALPKKKRPSPSSSSSPAPPPTGTKQHQQQQRKRKLPALAAHLAPSAPRPDDPSKHQGRTRTTPHVDGQWAAYVYVPIVLRRRGGGGALRRIVERAVRIAKAGDSDSDSDSGTTSVVVHNMLGGSESDSDAGAGAACEELHVSLTRPFFLRAYQREEMKRAVRDAAKAHPP